MEILNLPVPFILSVVLVISSLAIFLFWWSRRSQKAEMNRLAQCADRFAKGDFDTTTLAETTAKFEVLGTALRRMSSALKARIDEVEAEKAQLSAVLEHMEEGVIAVDRNRQV